MKIITLVIQLLAFCLYSKAFAFSIKIENTTAKNIPQDFILKAFNKANSYFESNFESINKEVLILITDKDCFRAGYDFTKNQVNFCERKDVINFGLDSIDVLNHELFHAFLCNYRNELCKNDLNIPVHEGLADYFSYLLNKDKCFGEKFYTNQECIRSYLTTNQLGFVQEDHAIGNVLVNKLIEDNIRLSDSIQLFKTYEPQDNVIENLFGRQPSKINKYRLNENDFFEIEYSFKNIDLISTIEWSENNQITIKQTDKFHFILSLSQNIKPTSILATFFDVNHKEIGHRKYYFGKKLSE